MGKFIKKTGFWFHRRSNLPILLVGALVVAFLFLNDDTSIELNMEYDREINDLKSQIASCNDSAEYYKRQRESILRGTSDLEHLARERFHMQRPTEDVYVIK